VGFWWSELTHPYFELTEKGYEVEVFSPNGGKCEADAMSDPRDASGYSASDLVSLGFIHTPKLAALVEATKAVSEIAVDRFDAIMVAGGQALMFTFEKASSLHQKFAAFYEAGKVACALCHGVAILRYAKTRDGQHIAKGKTVTGFANVVEDFADDGVEYEHARARQARDALAHRGRGQEAWRQLRAGRPLARFRDPRRQPAHGPAELLGRGDSTGPHPSPW
jgi:putative intracellular protease/amidase